MNAMGSQVMTTAGRIGDIELLRGLAVLGILVHHSQGGLLAWSTPALERFHAYFNLGHTLDLFFAISGFVIARDLLPKVQDTAADRVGFFRLAIGFWIRRAFRLLPSAWICLAAIVLLSLLFNQSNAFGSFRSNFAGAIAAMLQVANMHYAINAFSELGMGVTYHFWSLSLEEQFYLALPFMLFFGGRAFAWLAAAIVLAQLLSVRPGGGLVLYAWMFRTDALFLGVLLAWWSRGEVYPLFEPVFLRTRAWARWFTLVFLCVALATVGSDALRIVEYRLSIVAVLAALIVFVASWDRDYLMAPGAIKSFFMWLGSRSYSVYLWHLPVFSLVRELAFRYARSQGMVFDASHTWLFVAAAALLLLAVSECNFRLVEAPLRRAGISAAQRWTASA